MSTSIRAYPKIGLALALVAPFAFATWTTSQALVFYSWSPFWSDPLNAQAIIMGRVRSTSDFVPSDSLLDRTRSRLKFPRLAFTDYTVEVSQVWKGDLTPGKTIQVREACGMEDVPCLDGKHEMVLFLARDNSLLRQGRWFVTTLQPYVVNRGRVNGFPVSRLRVGEFRRLVADALASGTSPWACAQDSISTQRGQIRGRCLPDSAHADRVLFLHVRKARIVAVPHDYNGQFELPPLPPGQHRVDAILYSGAVAHTTIRAVKGERDSLVIALNDRKLDVRSIALASDR